MTKFKLYFVALVPLAFVACEPIVTPEQENGLINAIYQSLGLTPEQFAENMSVQGFHESAKYDFMSYISFTNVNLNTNYNYEERELVGMVHKGDTINQVIYERYLNQESNPAACYKLFSDRIASHGYTNWHGYYEYSENVDVVKIITEGMYYNSTAQTAKDRTELCNNINNDSLRQPNSTPYFIETFNYTHSDKSQWEGRIILYTTQHFSGIDENDEKEKKDIILSLFLERK